MELHAMEQKVIENINKFSLIDKRDLIVVGFSGGCDSTSLLSILVNISKIIDFKLIAIHVNHMLRDDEAFRDEKFCIDFCSKANINMSSVTVNVPELSMVLGKSAEEIGRVERYRIFNEIGLKHSVSSNNGSDNSSDNSCSYKIAVAHNRDDLTETVVLNLIRGTSVDGLKGIDFKRDNIIRPLLDIPREDLEKYCTDKGLQYVEDSTNKETLYKRNKIRHDVLPVLAAATEGNLTEKIYNMSRLIIDDIDFLTINSQNEYEKCLINNNEIIDNNKIKNFNKINNETKRISLNVKYFNTLHIALKRRIIRILIKNIYGNLQVIESTHINDVVDLAKKNKTGKYLCLPSMIRVKTEYDILTAWIDDNNQITETEKDKHYSVKINIPGETELTLNESNPEEETKLIIKAKLMLNKDKEFDSNSVCANSDIPLKQNRLSHVQKFDFDITGEDLFLRKRQEGDILSPYKFAGTKKLKKYFIDEKMPLNMRNQIPLVARDNEIIWVFGKTINQKYVCTSDTKNVIELEIEEV